MAQITNISGRIKKARMAKIIHKASKKARVFWILLSKDKPRTIRKVIISPLVKRWSSSFVLVGDGIMLSATSTKIDFLGFLTIANN